MLYINVPTQIQCGIFKKLQIRFIYLPPPASQYENTEYEF